MMCRLIVILLLSFCVGCARFNAPCADKLTPEQERLEGYAIASCLALQSNPYVRDQGDAWASIIIQQSEVDSEVFAGLSEKIKKELEKDSLAVMRVEEIDSLDKAVPLYFCYQITKRQSVRSFIVKNYM